MVFAVFFLDIEMIHKYLYFIKHLLSVDIFNILVDE